MIINADFIYCYFSPEQSVDVFKAIPAICLSYQVICLSQSCKSIQRKHRISLLLLLPDIHCDSVMPQAGLRLTGETWAEVVVVRVAKWLP